MIQWLTESFHSLLACKRSCSESMKKLQDAKDMGGGKIESLLREHLVVVEHVQRSNVEGRRIRSYLVQNQAG